MIKTFYILEGGLLMQSVIMLTINGEISFFKDTGLTPEEKKDIQKIAQLISQESSNMNIPTENEVSTYFVDKIKSCLGISLEHVEVSLVVRINCKTSS